MGNDVSLDPQMIKKESNSYIFNKKFYILSK